MSDSDTGKVGATVDRRVIEEADSVDSEEELFAEYFKGGGGDSDKLDFTGEWFPGKSEWQGKTRIYPHQSRPLAIIRNYFEYFDEIADIEPFVTGMIEDYEKYLTSVEGLSREQQVAILKAMHGSYSEGEEQERNFWAAMAGTMGDGEDE